MSNDHAKDRYDPPGIGTDWEENNYSDIVRGEVFRLEPNNQSKTYRKVDEFKCHDIKENLTTEFNPQTKVYVKS
jgi:hypothetical protein